MLATLTDDIMMGFCCKSCPIVINHYFILLRSVRVSDTALYKQVRVQRVKYILFALNTAFHM